MLTSYRAWVWKSREGLLDRLDGCGVQWAVGDDDAFVVGEGAAECEVEGLAVRVGDGSARFLDDEGAGGVVPDFFLIIGACGQAEVDVGPARG